ncbi:Na+/proline symporter [Pustulibacterium marinum]|uniref:Na+/proline symporter n=1 Tax=Pustulibacterium marinum TaxID=1224947 RepID=A0A1I7G481_9FLAO|nr:sodium:solute symporter family protein [Pustulibacterium marinum]SFU43249.1 Na+/proline symporter [Pustulibacterium marinum]
MTLATIDIAIIIGYILVIVLLGYLVSTRKNKDMDSYFLGGKTIPWYILGVSNASGMFDITGTMWMVAIGFIYGLKSVWIPWLWPVWNQIFLMIFLAVWLRRSNVLTGAEWLKTRFGEGKGAILSHLVVVIFAIVSVIGFIAYGFVGIGKFATSFFPWDLSFAIGSSVIPSTHTYAMVIMILTAIYVVKGGMYSVVMTEVIQFIVMTIACILVGFVALNAVTPEQISQFTPSGWDELFFGWKLDLDWSNYIVAVNDKISADGYEYMSILMMLMLFKGVLVSIAGPLPSYDMQRILAAKTPKEAAKMSGIVSLVLFIPRYFMIFGLVVLSLVYLSDDLNNTNGTIDFEMILPYTVNNFIPIGLKGLLLAGLISAFMSTYAANVNAGPAYIVNDIYKRFINKNASQKKLMTMSYLSSLFVVILGITLGLFIGSIDTILKWITAALFGGYTAANLLKWIWWRFNGYGYFYGMITGLVVSMGIPVFFPNASAINTFPILFVLSLAASVIASLVTPACKKEVLMDFYEKVRPWGFWKPVYQWHKEINPDFKSNTDFLRDMLNCGVGAIWQLSFILIPIYLLIGQYTNLAISIIVMVATSAILKFNWLDKLKNEPQ